MSVKELLATRIVPLSALVAVAVLAGLGKVSGESALAFIGGFVLGAPSVLAVTGKAPQS